LLQPVAQSRQWCTQRIGALRLFVGKIVLLRLQIGERQVVVAIDRIGVDRQRTLVACDSLAIALDAMR